MNNEGLREGKIYKEVNFPSIRLSQFDSPIFFLFKKFGSKLFKTQILEFIAFLFLASQQSTVNMSQEQVRAAHLLIKHTGSRNPVSRRTGEGVTLSPEDAQRELERYQAHIIKAGVDEVFPESAKARSDCSSYQKNGDLGHFSRGMMQRPFEEAAFALKRGEMSGIVSTDSGYHLIYRID